LIEDDTDALLDALSAGTLDAALIGIGRYDRPPSDVKSLLVAREPLVVAVHPRHRCAARGAIPLRELRDDPIVTLTRASKLRTTLEMACHGVGFVPRIAAETTDLADVVELTGEQLGVAVLPRSGWVPSPAWSSCA
jgi:DNA-binding transcriptional LysR family regulator